MPAAIALGTMTFTHVGSAEARLRYRMRSRCPFSAPRHSPGIGIVFGAIILTSDCAIAGALIALAVVCLAGFSGLGSF